MFVQFYVNPETKELSALMYQRSCDLGLGVPFNIASYALLTILIAHVCGLKPKEFTHTFGDAHVYLNHIDPLMKQLERTPRPFPKLFINNQNVKNIEDFEFDDIELKAYNPYPGIKMEMAV